jgi:hypothetical protein
MLINKFHFIKTRTSILWTSFFSKITYFFKKKPLISHTLDLSKNFTISILVNLISLSLLQVMVKHDVAKLVYHQNIKSRSAETILIP